MAADSELFAQGEVVIATRNKGKAAEFARLFEPRGLRVKSLNDFAGLPDIVEDGATFAANARIKARTVAAALGIPALADDSGLCVEALGGAPGVYSARYAGEGAADADNNAKLLSELRRLAQPTGEGRGLPQGSMAPAAAQRPDDGPRLLSRASFVCVLALVDARGETLAEAEGTYDGFIIDEPRGAQGFGYDPLFYLPELGLTMAELPLDRKNEMSHRSRAMQALFSHALFH